jgi:hypothetical protein
VSPSRSPTYAPTQFAKHPEALKAKVSSDAFEAAMERLFATAKIKVVTDGRASKQRLKIVRS